MTSNPGLLRIGLFNTLSVRNKLHHIAETLNEFDLDILCLTETWLFPSDIDIVRAALPKSHSIAHVPRTTITGAPGGGVDLIYSLAILNIKLGMAAFQASSFELMGASFSCHRETINIYVVYRPGHPGTDRAFMEEFGSFLDGLLLVGGNSVICGDFNYWLKATNERQDYGAGILHQEAQFPIDQVYLIYKAPMPLFAHARPRETRYWLQMQVGLCVPLNSPPLAHRGS